MFDEAQSEYIGEHGALMYEEDELDDLDLGFDEDEDDEDDDEFDDDELDDDDDLDDDDLDEELDEEDDDDEDDDDDEFDDWDDDDIEAAPDDDTSGAVKMELAGTGALGGDLYIDCLTLLLLSPLNFELQAHATEDAGEALADDRWQRFGDGMVPDDFAERMNRARWKAEREWCVRFDTSRSISEHDFETQARGFFEELSQAGVCRISQDDSYENPFEGMCSADFGILAGYDDPI